MGHIQNLKPRVIIDSGAFTVHSSGKTINPKDYGLWALDFRSQWEHKMQVLYFMNLDVIGDQKASWENQKKLESMGLNPIPIITVGASNDDIIRALKNYEYIAFGGLHDRTTIKSWLNHCFFFVMKQFKETGIMPKTHLLAQTTEWILKDYPCYSSDSSTWTNSLRFGDGTNAGIKQLPKYKDGEGALAATIHTLRANIRKYQKMQTDMTNLWTKRGIIFND
jgi:hypothetical protein